MQTLYSQAHPKQMTYIATVALICDNLRIISRPSRRGGGRLRGERLLVGWLSAQWIVISGDCDLVGV